MSGIDEALKGFTDIPIALVAFALFLCARKHKKPEDLAVLFLMISLTALVGAVMHIFVFPTAAGRIVRVLMHTLMYDAIFRFIVMFTVYLCDEHNLNVRHLRMLGVFLYICSAAAVLIFEDYDMLFFIAFASVGVVLFIISIVKAKGLRPAAALLFSLLPVLLLLQSFSGRLRFAVVLEHLIITGALFIVYFSLGTNPPASSSQ